LSANVVAGSQYAITVTGTGAGCWSWEADAGATYAGGQAFSSSSNPVSWAVFPTAADLGFKTYVTESTTAYTVSPFSQPVDNSPTENLAQAGKIIPFNSL